MPLRAAFIGDGSLLIRCAEIFSRAGNVIAGIATANSRIAEWSLRSGFPAFDWPESGRPGLDRVEFEYLFSIANLRVVPSDVLARATRCAINFHDSLLPRYAGLNATSWAIMAREAHHGISWHEMTADIDGGRILRQESFPLSPDDTAFTANAKCYEAAAQSFAHLLDDLQQGRLEFVEQAGPRIYFGRSDRPSGAATIDLARSADEIGALIRALDFGSYPNPLGLPKLIIGNDLLLVRSVEVVAPAPSMRPGQFVSTGNDRVVVSCADADICFAGLTALDGNAVGEVVRRNGVGTGHPPAPASREQLEAVSRYDRRAALRERWWSREFSRLAATALPYPRRGSPTDADLAQPIFLARSQETSTDPIRIVAGFIGWMARLTGASRVSALYRDTDVQDAVRGIETWFAPCVPLTVDVQPDRPVDVLIGAVGAAVEGVRRAGPYGRDLPLRLVDGGAVREAREALRVGIDLSTTDRGSAMHGCDVVLSVDPDSGRAALAFPRGEFAVPVVRTIARHLEFFLGEFLDGHAGALGEIPLVPPEERADLERRNRTAAPVSTARGIAEEIARQMRRTPAREAVRWGERTLDYAALDAQVGAIASRLRAEGAGRGAIVGIHLERTPDLMAAVLATLAVGAAYLPLDPAYPPARIRLMVEDSGAPLILTDRAHAGGFARDGARLVVLDEPEDEPRSAGDHGGLDGATASPDDLAYVIYTSGSTGRPKGVMVTHANVLNFFAGMDAVVPHAEGGRWLAVTSLSFDISVVELLWTLARGFTVVLHPPAADARGSAPAFSLFYFSSDEGAAAAGDKYRLLLEGAKFADREGFAAVWTPERHFHAFGGLYPNSAITSAAIAAVTRRVAIRAGSCVLPLHNPVRAAEDWALVDNLSNGRVGVSLASGWQPDDFVLAPEAFADRKNIMLKGVDTLRRLWRGEALPVRNPKGESVAVKTLPRPVQREIPLWLTAAGNPETFEQAGALGCGVLTHLLGQSLDDVAGKIELYRNAWRQAGHAGKPRVTLMLHTFVGESDDLVRETVRGPMKQYLRSSVDLIRRAAWSFPTFVQRATAAGRRQGDPFDAGTLSGAEMDAILDHAFERYFSASGLFGTIERCLGMVRRLAAVGVDEIACLVDFGVETDRVLDSLPRLKRLMDAAAEDVRPPERASVAEDILAHDVSHLQCTPSMASMLVADAAGRLALTRLDALLVGGEALPVPLARELRALVRGKLLNMYGPTETTIWSAACELQEVGEFVPLGTPIANTSLHVLDPAGRECPALVAGELHIGGAGVARGYLNQPGLTAERFIGARFADEASPRLYRTGDLVRRHPGGALEFLGRMDNQVKIRGHRVELGEIEALLASEPGVNGAAVVARPNGGGHQLLAYATPRPGGALDGLALRQRLAVLLPDFMVPARVIVLPAMPLTPNGKLDRAALPAADAAPVPVVAAPEGQTEALIASIWCEVLGVASVGRNDNFFDVGGHSLLVVQVQRRLQAATGHEIPIVDMFRYPTIGALAAQIDGRERSESAVARGVERARARRALLQRRAS